jgi:hypothetical protein
VAFELQVNKLEPADLTAVIAGAASVGTVTGPGRRIAGDGGATRRDGTADATVPAVQRPD